MSRSHIYSGSKFEEIAGYARAVVDGRWVFVSGTSGHDPTTGEISDDPADQCRQSLIVIGAALAEAGSGFGDVVRVRVFVSEPAHVWPVSAVIKETFDTVRPTNTTVVTGFADPAMKVELEVTALKADA